MALVQKAIESEKCSTNAFKYTKKYILNEYKLDGNANLKIDLLDPFMLRITVRTAL